MIEYSWLIHDLERDPQTGAIQTVHWRLIARENDHVTDAYGALRLDDADTQSPNFIEYANVSKENVISWVEQKIGEEVLNELKNALQNQIEQLKSPKVLNGVPW